jgi:hypothetical protein
MNSSSGLQRHVVRKESVRSVCRSLRLTGFLLNLLFHFERGCHTRACLRTTGHQNPSPPEPHIQPYVPIRSTPLSDGHFPRKIFSASSIILRTVRTPHPIQTPFVCVWIILKLVLKTGWGDTDWFDLAQDRGSVEGSSEQA